MVEIATCSYGEFRPQMGVPVQISIGFPKFVTWYKIEENCWTLTPRSSYIKEPDDAVFYGKLREQMEAVGFPAIRAELQAIADRHDGQRLVLLCYEKLSVRNDCHRTFVRKWLMDQSHQWPEPNLNVPELGATKADGGWAAQNPTVKKERATPVEPPCLF